ncbi:MAG: glycosyltransferase family 4 protein [Desulfurococcaceae archaeon]
MSNRKAAILVVAEVSTEETVPTGGVLRSTRAIKEYTKHFNVYLLISPHLKADPTYVKNSLGVEDTIQCALFPRALFSKERLSFTYIMIPPRVLRLLMKNPRRLNVDPDAIVVLNESYNCLSIGRVLKEEYGAPSLAMLQLPVLYHDKRRREQIVKAFELWYQELYADDKLGGFIRKFRTRFELLVAWSRLMKSLLNSYDILLAVSRAVVHEMGEEFSSKFYVLDPGVSLDHRDVELIQTIKKHGKERKNHVVFGGRVDALKGFIEGLYVFKEIVKTYPSLKLIATGYVGEKLRLRVEKLVRRLNLEDKVVLTGVVPRVERFKLIAEAKLVLYPSHVDAYPYSVLESLMLGTPVVAYDIPALRLYYGSIRGVHLVREGDVEALSKESIDVLSSRTEEVEPPKLRSWDDILEEEISVIKNLATRTR